MSKPSVSILSDNLRVYLEKYEWGYPFSKNHRMSMERNQDDDIFDDDDNDDSDDYMNY